MNEANSFRSGLALGMGFGILGGAVSALWYHKQKTMTPDQVLENVKHAFLKEGTIEGSWISFEKQPIRKFAVRSEAYEGGISRIEDGRLTRYEFVADAYTGTVLDITRAED